MTNLTNLHFLDQRVQRTKTFMLLCMHFLCLFCFWVCSPPSANTVKPMHFKHDPTYIYRVFQPSKINQSSLKLINLIVFFQFLLIKEPNILFNLFCMFFPNINTSNRLNKINFKFNHFFNPLCEEKKCVYEIILSAAPKVILIFFKLFMIMKQVLTQICSHSDILQKSAILDRFYLIRAKSLIKHYQCNLF